MTRKASGFTLIEVLIALMIIAIALTAVIEATTASTRNTIHTREVMLAHWIGMNVVTELQAGLMRMPHSGEPQNGESKMMNKTWRWRVMVEKSSEYPSLVEITVKVENVRRQLINTVVGYAKK